VTPLAAFDLTTAVVALLGGGFFTGVVALLKVRPERDAVVVTAAQGALVVQSEVMDDLKEEIIRLREENAREREARTRTEQAAQHCEKALYHARALLREHGLDTGELRSGESA